MITPTAGELLWTWRKRRKLTIVRAARALGVTRLAYAEAEHDRWPEPVTVSPPVKPTRGELLRICRKRSDVARDDVAARLGVCHVTFLKLERQADQRVVDLWFSDVTADP